MRAGPRRLRRHNRLLARALCSVAPALRPSFLRRPRDHGRSSRETDQDQNRRGEAVRSRQRLLSLASCGPRGWAACRPEAAAGLQASPGAPRPAGTGQGRTGLAGAGARGPAAPPPPLPQSPSGRAARVAAAPPLGRRGRGAGGAVAAIARPARALAVPLCARAPGLSAHLPGGRRVHSITCPQVDAQAGSEVSGVRGLPGPHQK